MLNNLFQRRSRFFLQPSRSRVAPSRSRVALGKMYYEMGRVLVKEGVPHENCWIKLYKAQETACAFGIRHYTHVLGMVSVKNGRKK